MAQLIINNKISATVKKLLFGTNYGIHINVGHISKRSFQKIKTFEPK